MELALLKACHNTITRILTLPESHPLNKIVTTAKQELPTKFLSPIDDLIKKFELTNTNIETIYPKASLKGMTIKFTTTIDQTRKESIKSTQNDDADYKIYLHGPGQENGIGSAAILYKKGNPCGIKPLQAYIGTPDKHNTYEAEILGAILTTWTLQNTPETIGKIVSLYTDNQSIIAAIMSNRTKTGQYLINNLTTAANSLKSNLNIKWISGHSKVKGNKEVDKLAKRAAAGQSSTMINLPHLLRNPLPLST